MSKINNHGDLILYPIKTIKPPKKTKASKIHVLQDSGATGNRHEIVSKKELIYHWTDKNGQEYISCKKDYIIRHVGGDCEHGEQIVESGTRKVLHEMEHDVWLNELRVVID